jgi:hypothetical protein
MLIFGTLPRICFAGGMTSFLYERKIRIFDYPKFAEPFRNRIRGNAEKMAAEAGIEIEFVRKRNFRKEDRVKEILARRGEQGGLVCIFSAMEPCSTYKPWHNKQTKHIWFPTTANACITTFTSWTRNWACAMCACRRGCHAGSRSASTGITGWQAS